jgi:hypothetical protein
VSSGSSYWFPPSVGSDEDGNFVVVWGSYYYGIRGQRFDDVGMPLGTEFGVTDMSSYTYDPVVAVELDGDFIVAWTNGAGLDGESGGVFAKRYGSDGLELGSSFQVNTYTPEYQTSPAVAVDAFGRFVVAWSDFAVVEGIYPGQDADREGVRAQLFDSGGNKVGVEFQVNSYTVGGQFAPAVAFEKEPPPAPEPVTEQGTVSGKPFVVVWTSNHQDDFGDGVFGQRYDSDGTPAGTEFQVNTYTLGYQSGPSLDTDAQGNFVVVWNSGSSSYYYGYATSGGFEVEGGGPPSYYQDGNYSGVFGQRFGSDGSRSGGEFQVNSYTVGYQSGPSIAIDDNARFVVTWVDEGPDGTDGQDGDDRGIQGQYFASDGTPLGSEFQVNTYTLGSQAGPSISVGAGNFVVVWSAYFDTDGIYGQRFLARCGDGELDPGEECDPPDDISCSSRCENLS